MTIAKVILRRMSVPKTVIVRNAETSEKPPRIENSTSGPLSDTYEGCDADREMIGEDAFFIEDVGAK